MARLVTVTTKQNTSDPWLLALRGHKNVFLPVEWEVIKAYYVMFDQLPGVIPESKDSYTEGNILYQAVAFDTLENALSAQALLDPATSTLQVVQDKAALMRFKMEQFGVPPYSSWTKVLP